MGILASLGAVIGSLASIAASIGLSNLSDYISAKQNSKDGLSSEQIVNATTKITAEARKQGNNAVNKVLNRMNALQLPYGISSSIKDKIMDSKRQLRSQLLDTQNKVSAIEIDLNNAENRANTLAATPEGARRAIGKQALEDIKEDLIMPISRMGIIEKGVDKYVSKKRD